MENESKQLSDKMMNTLSTSLTGLGLAIGVRMGLFEVMKKWDVAKSSSDIAAEAGCKERYVREWLEFMVAADWMMYEKETQKYYLTHVQRQVLTSGLAKFMVALPSMAMHFSTLCECFTKEGPNGYDPQGAINRHVCDWNHEIDDTDKVNQFLDIVPEMTARLEKGAKMCEIGCGIGSVLYKIAQKFPEASFVGCDLLQESIGRAKNLALEKAPSNLSFMVQDGAKMPQHWTGSFDVVYSRDVIHDLPEPTGVLKEVRRILKDDGVFVMSDRFSHGDVVKNKSLPLAEMLYGCSLFNCVPASMNSENPAGFGVMWGPVAATNLLSKNGFRVEPYRIHDYFMIFAAVKEY